MPHATIRIIREEHAALSAMLRSILLHLAQHRRGSTLRRRRLLLRNGARALGGGNQQSSLSAGDLEKPPPVEGVAVVVLHRVEMRRSRRLPLGRWRGRRVWVVHRGQSNGTGSRDLTSAGFPPLGEPLAWCLHFDLDQSERLRVRW